LVDGADGSLYHFTGTDLSSLTDNGAVFSGQGSGWEQFVRKPSIDQQQVNGQWIVYYDGRQGFATSEHGAIGRVETADFATFTNRQQVLAPALWWEQTDQVSPSVVRVNDLLVMAYSGFNSTAFGGSPFAHWIGVAKSSDDGLTWTKLPEQVPIIVPEQADSQASVDDPSLYWDGTNLDFVFVTRGAAVDADITHVRGGAALLDWITV